LHSCGKAIDVCQLSRGRVDGRCNLPGPRVIAQIASAHGLFEGGQWCNSDYGHAQIGVSAIACGERTLAAKRHRRVTRMESSWSGRNSSFAYPQTSISY
jgi:hypothetical protein